MKNKTDLLIGIDSVPYERWALLVASGYDRLSIVFREFSYENKIRDSFSSLISDELWGIARDFNVNKLDKIKNLINKMSSKVPHSEDYCTYWSMQAIYFISYCHNCISGIEESDIEKLSDGIMNNIYVIYNFLLRVGGGINSGFNVYTSDEWIFDVPLMKMEIKKIQNDIYFIKEIDISEIDNAIAFMKRDNSSYGLMWPID